MRMQLTKLGLLVGALALVSGTAAAQTVGFTTLQPGAIYHLKAQIISKVVQQHAGLQMRVIPVAGTTASVVAVQNRDAEFTLGEVNQMDDAIRAQGEFERLKPMPDLRVVFKVVDFPIGIMVRKDSDIHKLEDLKGKRFPVGWQAFPNGVTLAQGVLASAGMTLDDINGVNVSGLIPQADDFAAGKLDAALIALPAPKVKEVDSKIGGIRWLSLPDTPEALAGVQQVKPDYGIITINPAPPHAGVTEPTNFLRIHTVVMTSRHVPDDVVYGLLKAVMENRDELVKGHPIFNGFFPDQRASPQFSAVEYHPGAIKYFKERGFWPGS